MIVAVMFSVASGACGNATGGDVTSAVDGGARVDGGMNDGGPADGGTPFVACLPAPVLPPDLGCALPDAFDDALTEAGLTRDTLRFNARDWALFPNSLAHDAFRLPFFDAIHDEPLRAPGWGRALVGELDAAAESTRPASALLQVVAQRMGHALDACALPPTSDKNGFFDAIVALHEGAPLDDEAALREAVTRVPEALRRALTPILRASHDAARARDEAFAALTEAQRQLFFDTAIGLFLPSPIGAPRLSQTAVRDALQSGIRMDVLYAAAARLTATIEAADLRPFAGLRGFEFTARTPRGGIVLRDGADHDRLFAVRVRLRCDVAPENIRPRPSVQPVSSTTSQSFGTRIAPFCAPRWNFASREIFFRPPRQTYNPCFLASLAARLNVDFPLL